MWEFPWEGRGKDPPSHGREMSMPKDDRGLSPWDLACRSNRPSMKRMFRTERDSRFPCDFDLIYHDELPLHQAVSHGSMDALRLLLKQKHVDLEAHDRDGNTPLHLAVRSQSREAMNLLLGHPRVRVNCEDKNGNTPLWLSTHLSCNAVTERLLEERRVKVNFIGGHGDFQALDFSASRRARVEHSGTTASPGCAGDRIRSLRCRPVALCSRVRARTRRRDEGAAEHGPRRHQRRRIIRRFVRQWKGAS